MCAIKISFAEWTNMCRTSKYMSLMDIIRCASDAYGYDVGNPEGELLAQLRREEIVAAQRKGGCVLISEQADIEDRGYQGGDDSNGWYGDGD
jgi:hypothetical protein